MRDRKFHNDPFHPRTLRDVKNTNTIGNIIIVHCGKIIVKFQAHVTVSCCCCTVMGCTALVVVVAAMSNFWFLQNKTLLALAVVSWMYYIYFNGVGCLEATQGRCIYIANLYSTLQSKYVTNHTETTVQIGNQQEIYDRDMKYSN